MTHSKTCPHCREEFTRRKGEWPKRFQQRQHCSRECEIAARTTTPIPDRACGGCGKPLVQQEGEKPSRFAKRKYCGRACFAASRRGKPRRGNYPAPRPQVAVRKRGSRDLSFSLADRAPTGVEHLGQTRDYGRVQPLGEPCEKHPSDVIGFFGCPACNAGARWAKRQRETTFRPSHEGGR